MHGPILIHYPKVQFFRPDELTSQKRPGFGHDLHIFQTGLREEFSADDCDRPHGTPRYYFLVRFDHPTRIWDGQRMVESPAGSTVLWAPGVRQRYGVVGGQMITHSYVFVRGRAVEV